MRLNKIINFFIEFIDINFFVRFNFELIKIYTFCYFIIFQHIKNKLIINTYRLRDIQNTFYINCLFFVLFVIQNSHFLILIIFKVFFALISKN